MGERQVIAAVIGMLGVICFLLGMIHGRLKRIDRTLNDIKLELRK